MTIEDGIPLGGDPRAKVNPDGRPIESTVNPPSINPTNKPKPGPNWERRWVILSVLIMSVVLFTISFIWGLFEQAVVAWISGWWGLIIGFYFGQSK